MRGIEQRVRRLEALQPPSTTTGALERIQERLDAMHKRFTAHGIETDVETIYERVREFKRQWQTNR